MSVKSPDQELRFTRSGQAPVFGVMAAIFASVAITLLASAIYRAENPQVPHPLWALPPLALAILSARTALRLTRHAYLIFTPLGIEIFPFFRPAKGMQLMVWQEIHEAEVSPDLTCLTLHRNAEKTSGIHLSLKPIRPDRRVLLAKAITGRLSPPQPVS
jgi:hypothetical protein